jgi:hypothetical protein
LFFELISTYEEIVGFISFDGKIGGITGIVAKRRFCLSCTDKRGLDLIKIFRFFF